MVTTYLASYGVCEMAFITFNCQRKHSYISTCLVEYEYATWYDQIVISVRNCC